MKIKSIATLTLLCGTLVSSLNADFINYGALEKMHISASYGMMDLDGENTNTLNYEFGYDILFDSFTVGANYIVEVPEEGDSLQYGSIELDVGYRTTPKTNIYALLAYDFSEDQTVDGLGFGLGVKYQLVDYVAITSKVKYSNMSPVVGNSYGKTIATVGIEFNLKTVKDSL